MINYIIYYTSLSILVLFGAIMGILMKNSLDKLDRRLERRSKTYNE